MARDTSSRKPISPRKPKARPMPYKELGRGGTSAGPVPSEISRGEIRRESNQPSMDDRVYRTMPITEPQLKQIKKLYGIE